MNLFKKDRALSLGEVLDLVEAVPGAHIRCSADKGTFERVVPVNADRRTLWRAGQLAALRAPANRSKLVGLEFLVLQAIGRNAWNNLVFTAVDPATYESPEAYVAWAWRSAMDAMRDFYQQAASRKGITF